MKTILSIILKEIRQLKRDRRMLPIIFLAPIFQLTILGYAANMDVTDIPLLICDQDGSQQSRELVSRFVRSGYFVEKQWVDNINEVDTAIEQGSVAVALIIPPHFQRDILSGHKVILSLIVDGSESNSATLGLGYASLIINHYSQQIMLKKIAHMPQINTETRIWYNPQLQSRNFMVPGILAMLLMLITMLLTSLSIVKEKENGTLEQLLVTPIKPLHLIIGKLTPFVVIGFIDVILVVATAALMFGLYIKGSILLLLALSAVFIMTTLGLGLFISTISQTQGQAMMTSVFFVILPLIMLSGFVFPIENMPPLIQLFTTVLPLRYYFVIIRGLFLKGVGFMQLWKEALALVLFGIVILGGSVLRFRKRLE